MKKMKMYLQFCSYCFDAVHLVDKPTGTEDRSQPPDVIYFCLYICNRKIYHMPDNIKVLLGGGVVKFFIMKKYKRITSAACAWVMCQVFKAYKQSILSHPVLQ